MSLGPLTRVNQVANRGNEKLEGIPELRAAMEAIGNEVATKVGRKANRDAATLIRDALYQKAPYRPGVQKKSYTSKKGKGSTQTDYGDLRDNIKVRLAKARKEGTITYNVTTGAAFWGFFLEFGTKHMAAQPWMRPTFDAYAGRLIDLQIDRLKTGIESAAKKAARIKGPR